MDHVAASDVGLKEILYADMALISAGNVLGR